MGFAKFRAAFVGGACDDWSVTPSEGFLKQNEVTHFAVRFKPNSPGVSAGYFVIETEVRLVVRYTRDHFYNFADGLPCINSS